VRIAQSLKSTKEDERPARQDGTCFFCGTQIGDVHNSDCVIRIRTVVVEHKIQWIKEVPEDWDREMIEFDLNESSCCIDNDLIALGKKLQERETLYQCACDSTESHYVRDATVHDHKKYSYVYKKD